MNPSSGQARDKRKPSLSLNPSSGQTKDEIKPNLSLIPSTGSGIGETELFINLFIFTWQTWIYNKTKRF